MVAPAFYTEPEKFELLVGARTADGYPLTVVQSPAGEANAHCRLDPSDGELQDALQSIADQNADAAFLSEVGGFLFGELFAGEVGGLLASSLNTVRVQGARLCIRLRFEAPELAALPWELLHNPDETSFLAISPETALVRFVPMRLPVRPTAVKPPLRILVVIASPHGLAPLDVQREKHLIHEALYEHVRSGLVRLESVERATVAAISEAMRSFRPHVFHFVGHGLFADERAWIALEREDGATHLVGEQDFREFFTTCAETRLAVLNACQTATISSSRPLSGIAPHLLQRQLSAVLAMQVPVSERAAQVMAREFYRSLALGYPVDAAAAEARKGIFLELGGDRPDWAAPVLFLRAKDGAIFEVQTESTPSETNIPSPPEPIKPPAPTHFVGRQAELAFYRENLRTAGVAVIAGMAGVGKSALAAVLATAIAPPEKIFWHSFRPDEGLEVIIWKLAGFLAWHGAPALWQMLHGALQNGGQSPPLDLLFDYAFQQVRGKDLLLCVDDFQYVEHDPRLEEWVERVTAGVRVGELRLILTSRAIPNVLRPATFRPLNGLNRQETRQLAALRNLTLPEHRIDFLHQHIEGNAELLNIAIDALLHTDTPEQLLNSLVRAESIERFLLDRLDSQLAEAERKVESAVAVLGYPSTRDAIEMVLQQAGLERTIFGLCDRFLLTAQTNGQRREYDQHALLRAFYYERPNNKERREMHRSAAEYYESEEPDLFRAAWHFARAGDLQWSATLAANNVWPIINRNHVQGLRQLLERFASGQLPPIQWAEVNLARGEVYTFLGESVQAQASYEQALATLQPMADSPVVRILKAQVYMGLADLLRYSEPRTALQWLRRGVDEYGGQADLVAADLAIKTGLVLINTGEFAEARQSLERGLALLPSAPSPRRATALINLGNIFGYQGDLARSTEYSQAALAICEQIRDHYRMVAILQNLGIDQALMGRWDEALVTCRRALDLSQQLGDVNRQTTSELALGNIYLRRGDDQAATTHLIACLELTARHDLRKQSVWAHTSLADLRIRQGDAGAAERHLAEAERIATALDARADLPEICRHWAELALLQGAPDAAIEQAMRSIQLAGELEMELEAGMSQRVLGEALVAAERIAEAMPAFERGLAQLEDRDPYETARLKAVWGRALVRAGESAAAAALLNEARVTFDQLGARSAL
jgi:tetratricopeptide (TPR) repeat protein